MAERKTSIMWRHLTTVNESIANSDVCRQTVHYCGNIRWKPVKKRNPKETKGGEGGGKSLRQTQTPTQRSEVTEPFQRGKQYPGSLLSDENDISVMTSIGSSALLILIFSKMYYYFVSSHHKLSYKLTCKLYADIPTIYWNTLNELFYWNWQKIPQT